MQLCRLGLGALFSLAACTHAFRTGLKEAGFIESENVAIEYRWADNQIERLPMLAAELVHRRVAVIAAVGAPSTFAAKPTTTTIPIVFLVPEDPVRLGLVTSLARPGGNLTGVNWFPGEVAAKRLELLRELAPRAARIVVLLDPAGPRARRAPNFFWPPVRRIWD